MDINKIIRLTFIIRMSSVSTAHLIFITILCTYLYRVLHHSLFYLPPIIDMFPKSIFLIMQQLFLL